MGLLLALILIVAAAQLSAAALVGVGALVARCLR